MEFPIHPLGSRVLVQKVRVEEQMSPGGVIIPGDSLDKNTYKAEVVAVGPTVTLVEAGNLILMTQFAGDAVSFQQEELRILNEEDVLATIDRITDSAQGALEADPSAA